MHARTLTRTTAAAVFAMALWATAACGSIADEAGDQAGEQLAEQLAEAQTGGEVDIDSEDGSYSIETDEGSFEVGGGEVPEAWPADVALPDGLEVISTSTSDTTDGKLVAIVASTSSSPEDLLAELKATLSGWEVSGETTSSSGDGSLTAAQWDRAGARVNFTASGDGSQTSVTISHTTIP
jgi:hypothetical protein